MRLSLAWVGRWQYPFQASAENALHVIIVVFLEAHLLLGVYCAQVGRVFACAAGLFSYKTMFQLFQIINVTTTLCFTGAGFALTNSSENKSIEHFRSFVYFPFKSLSFCFSLIW